jgi:hypothetical protein
LYLRCVSLTSHRRRGSGPARRLQFIIPFVGEHVHALRSRERGCFLVVQTVWAEKIQSTTDAGSLNTFGRNEIEVAPISSALLRIACLVILYKPCGVQKLPGGSFSYDTLILAVGSRANDFGTPGVTENCHFIDDIGQALLFSDRLRSRILIAIAARTDLHLVIVGGGATGVELAAELSHYMETLSRYATDEMPTHLRMTLIESGPRLLGPFPERISKSVEAKLRHSASTLERIRR